MGEGVVTFLFLLRAAGNVGVYSFCLSWSLLLRLSCQVRRFIDFLVSDGNAVFLHVFVLFLGVGGWGGASRILDSSPLR